jgi:MEMO1 family protein
MDMKAKLIREASHAGSWYDANSQKLLSKFNEWLSNAKGLGENKMVKGVIGPHAGYTYCGATAAYAYININPQNYNRVFLLGPCHYKAIRGCGLPSCSEYETPLGNIQVDTEIVQSLSKLQHFKTVNKEDEEQEHSLEMHLPYIKHAFGENKFTLIPIMVGSINPQMEEYFGKILADYLKDDKNLFVISSDFCHWGANFGYYPYNKEDGEIWQSIEKLDRRGIDLITNQDPEGFVNYLEETENTICGRHPISVYLQALKHSGLNTKTELLFYTQSSKNKTKKQSSVSYASIATYLL